MIEIFAQVDPTGLTGMVDDFQATGIAIAQRSFGWGLVLFAALSGVGIMSYLWKNRNVGQESIAEGFFEWIWVFGTGMVLLTVLQLAWPVLPTIIGSIASILTGQPAVAVNPFTILEQGTDLAFKIMAQPSNAILAASQGAQNPSVPAQVLHEILPISGITDQVKALAESGHAVTLGIWGIVAVIAAVLVAIMFAVIAAQWIMAIVSLYVVCSLGAFQVGFHATPGVSGWAHRWYGAVYTNIFRLITITVVCSLISTTLAKWAVLTQSTDMAAMAPGWIRILVGSVVCLVIVNRLPALAAEAMGGPPSMGGGDLIGTTRGVGSGIGGVVSGAGKAGKAAGNGVSKGVKILR
jgi:hypothetical protein